MKCKLTSPFIWWGVAVVSVWVWMSVWFNASAWAEELAPGSQFSDVTRLPSRLTAYNAHDDSARATYTCCRPDQKEEIARALKANADFLTLFANTDFAPYTLAHNARIYRVSKDFRNEVKSLEDLYNQYPDSDVADDALFLLSQLYKQDWRPARSQQLQALTLLLEDYPDSIYAPHALLELGQLYVEERQEGAALEAFQRLVRAYPHSKFCDDALWSIGNKYREMGNYPAAIEAFVMLRDRFPFSPYADDALLGIGNCYRHAKNRGMALEAFQTLIHEYPGSPLTRQAAQEVNALTKGAYNLSGVILSDTAEDAFKEAKHYERYKHFDAAIRAYRFFLNTYRGNDRCPEALFNIGKCYQQLNVLLDKVNKAAGPEDLYRLLPEWRDAVGKSKATIPTGKQLESATDATSVFMLVAKNAVGSDLRSAALYEIAQIYWYVGDEEKEAMALQQMLTAFPGDCGPCELQGWYKVLKYYQNPANYPRCVPSYKALAKAFPALFPADLSDNRADFLATMRFYFRSANHAWLENHIHHIGYLFNGSDLMDDALFVKGALALQRGEPRKACDFLKKLVEGAPGGALAAPGYFLLAKAHQRLGAQSSARKAYQTILSQFADSGLADDAQQGLTELTELTELEGNDLDIASLSQWASEKVNMDATDIANMDVWRGRNVVVFVPYLQSPKLRQYNLPNIWDAAAENLKSWSGNNLTKEKPVVIVLDEERQSRQNGSAIRLSACGVGDPPNWHLGLYELSRAFLSDGIKWSALGEMTPVWIEAFCHLGAATLQYNLVSETRDTIGSASAVKLAHEDVIRMREGALKALEAYVRSGADLSKMNSQVASGILLHLLDSNGYGRNELIDWRPYRKFFQALREAETAQGESGLKAQARLLLSGLNKAFNTDVAPQLKKWGFPVESDGAAPARFQETGM